jgi:hypothetical protein
MMALMVLFLVSLSVALARAPDKTAKAKAAQEEGGTGAKGSCGAHLSRTDARSGMFRNIAR